MKNYIHLFIKNKPFGLNVLNTIVSSIGNRLTYLTVIQILLLSNINYTITGISLITLIRILPPMLLSTIVGKIVDKKNRATIMLGCDLIEGITIFSLTLFNNIYYIFIVFIINSILDVFADISSFAYIDQILDRSDVFIANSFISSARSSVNIIGPAIAGFIIGYFGNQVAFLIDSGTFFFGFICTALCKFYYKKDGSVKSNIINKSNINNSKNVFEYIKNNINLKYLFLSMAIVVLIVECQSPLMFIFGKQFLGLNVSKSSLFLTAMGVGSLISSLIFIKIKKIFNDIKNVFFVITLDGTSLVLLTLVHNFYFSLVCFSVFGITSSVFFICIRNVIQNEVSNEIIGRIYSIQSLINSPLKIISILIGTYLSNITSTIIIFRYSGFIEIFASIIILMLFLHEKFKNKIVSIK